MVQMHNLPASKAFLAKVTFRVLPKSRWGSVQGCDYAGHSHPCPVYESTAPMPHKGGSKLRLSLWKHTTSKIEGAWVMTWSMPNKPMAEQNLDPPYGIFASSANSREYYVTQIKSGWGMAPIQTTNAYFHCLDQGPPPAPPAPPSPPPPHPDR